jgi:hypothetical protein
VRLIVILGLVMAGASAASAQERPFLFSVTTGSPDAKPAMRFDYDVGVGERAFQSDVANQPEQRIGVQGSLGRLTVLARLGIAAAGSSYQSSQSVELLYSALPPASQVSLAAGGGVLHEPDGTNVLLSRIVAGRATDASDLYGNLLFQKPLSSQRDALDLISSAGWARKLSHDVSLGVEAIGEDLEGFWEADEAEGGARLLVGPSVRVSPHNQRWQLIATGGPLLHPTTTGRASSAFRDLPPDANRTSYAVKASLSIALGAER